MSSFPIFPTSGSKLTQEIHFVFRAIRGLSVVKILLTLFLALMFSANALAQDAPSSLDLNVLPSAEGDLSPDRRTVKNESGYDEALPEKTPVERNNNTPAGGEQPAPKRFLELILASGWIGLTLAIASMFAATLTIKFSFTLRRVFFVSKQLSEEVSNSLMRGDVNSALLATKNSESLLSQILQKCIAESDRGWEAVEKELEDSCASLNANLMRKTEPLSIVGNVAPMLGLLGTVMGMVSTFGELAVDDGTGRNLANGIYFALVTTVAGLLVAIPSLVAHSLLNSRLDKLINEMSECAESALSPLKRYNSPQLRNQTTSSTSSPTSSPSASTPRQSLDPVLFSRGTESSKSSPLRKREQVNS